MCTNGKEGEPLTDNNINDRNFSFDFPIFNLRTGSAFFHSFVSSKGKELFSPGPGSLSFFAPTLGTPSFFWPLVNTEPFPTT